MKSAKLRAGKAGFIRNPCTASHCSARRNSSCAGVETPSATIPRLRSWPRAMIARTIAASSASPADVLDERAIDLQRVEREALEVVERAVACSEIVHGEREAEFLQRQQRASPCLDVLHQHAFGKLELEERRRAIALGRPFRRGVAVSRAA